MRLTGARSGAGEPTRAGRDPDASRASGFRDGAIGGVQRMARRPLPARGRTVLALSGCLDGGLSPRVDSHRETHSFSDLSGRSCEARRLDPGRGLRGTPPPVNPSGICRSSGRRVYMAGQRPHDRQKTWAHDPTSTPRLQPAFIESRSPRGAGGEPGGPASTRGEAAGPAAEAGGEGVPAQPRDALATASARSSRCPRPRAHGAAAATRISAAAFAPRWLEAARAASARRERAHRQRRRRVERLSRFGYRARSRSRC